MRTGLALAVVLRVSWVEHSAPYLGGGALVDVAYLSPTLLEARGGIRTKPNPLVGATEGDPWCDEPFQPIRYAWLVQGDTLTVTPAGPKLCDGQSDVWAGDWTRG